MRKRKPKIRVIAPDPRYQDQMVTKFVNNIMRRGKKNTAYKLFYDAMEIVKSRANDNEHEIWQRALSNVTPQVEVRSRRIGGATFQIPTEIHPSRKLSIGMKWLIKFASQRSGKGMAEKLAAEVIAAAKGEGAAVKKKEDTHRMAEANKAFAHFKV
ncbi:MAG TPA: 30S ribosomal protein S7 [Saprospiraceae bacterium]|nr:30S ribosomal protein S7 [Saprospiraceae bacterium]MCB9269749.1 30S ribosomal protein S7 [Lewinellaceae bacterium]HPG06631.1 30S ribosomal protein S7 [Saprospiraceae bacterium]HPQ99104.1 30S ribosomal protein S7 [Saprospiraceae bacterium]HQU51704.1 30S ribosomal protein S7 [Saprospiraceae bacterium]